MPIFFPQATPYQLELCELLHLSVKPLKLATHHQELLFSHLNNDLLSRVNTKVRLVSDKEISGYVLATESALIYRKHIYERPKFKMDALALLSNLSGHTHNLCTAWVYKHLNTGKLYSGVEETKITFRDISEAELTNYVNDHDVVKFIGGFDPLHSNALGFIDKIEGSLTNCLYNLPIEKIKPILENEKI